MDPSQRERVQSSFVRESSRIKGYIIGLVADLSLADDVFQDVFLTVSRKAEDFREGSDFHAWVRAIARFKALEAVRERRRTGSGLAPDVVELLAADAPDDDADDARRRLALHACLARVAPRAQEIARLRYVSDLGPEAIAARISWTANAVNVALSRLRKQLRACLQQRLAGEGSP